MGCALMALITCGPPIQESCKKWNCKATGVGEGQGVVRAQDRGSVSLAGGTAYARPHGGVSELSAGVPVKEPGLPSLGSHRRV